MPSKAHCPQPWGQRVGGVSGGPTRATWRSGSNPATPYAARVATVEGTLIRRMSSAFAGGRWNASLGWSVSSAGGSFPGRQTHRRQQVSSGKMRRGTSSACAKRTHSSRRRPTSASTGEDTSFTQSRDPCTSIVTVTPSTRRKPSRGRWRDGLRYRGRASPRKWEQTGTGVLIDGRLRGSPRVTALLVCGQPRS